MELGLKVHRPSGIRREGNTCVEKEEAVKGKGEVKGGGAERREKRLSGEGWKDIWGRRARRGE